jgi:acyl carrier protein
MRQPEIINQLQKIYNSVFLEPVNLTSVTNRMTIPEWDWISDIYFIIAVEDVFKVRFKIGEVESAKNISELADLIIRRTQGLLC